MATVLMHNLAEAGVSVEAIRVQNPKFFKELTKQFTKMREDAYGSNRKSSLDRKQAQVIEDIVKKYTNINVLFYLPVLGTPNAYAVLPDLKANHAMFDYVRVYTYEEGDGILQRIRRGKMAPFGTIDLEKGRVGGAWADIEMQTCVSRELLMWKALTPAEVAAVYLHEIGHVFTYFELIDRSLVINQALDSTQRELLELDDPIKKAEIIDGVATFLEIKDIDSKTLVSSSAKVISQVILTRALVAKLPRHGGGGSLYDAVICEQLADQFAARQGAGRDLVTALDKMNKAYNSPSGFGFLAFYAIDVLVWVSLILLAAFPNSLSAYATRILIARLRSNPNYKIYDYDKIRYSRIKEQLVSDLKGHPAADKKRVTESILAIEDVMSGVNNFRSIHRIIFTALLPGASRQYDQELVQRELEELANNDLYTRAALLKQL